MAFEVAAQQISDNTVYVMMPHANCLAIIGCALKGQQWTSLSIALEDSVGDNAVDFNALDKVDANHVKRPLEFTGVNTFLQNITFKNIMHNSMHHAFKAKKAGFWLESDSS